MAVDRGLYFPDDGLCCAPYLFNLPVEKTNAKSENGASLNSFPSLI